jgi:hypothetical protein
MGRVGRTIEGADIPGTACWSIQRLLGTKPPARRGDNQSEGASAPSLRFGAPAVRLVSGPGGQLYAGAADDRQRRRVPMPALDYVLGAHSGAT